jgi:hypothetical protein
MKKLWMVIAVVAVMLIGATVAFAAAAKTPAEIVAGLTGKTAAQAQEARQDGKSYGAQAAEANKLEAFKTERLEQYKLMLDEAVKEKRITQEKADTLYKNMQSRMAGCTGNGNGSGKGQGSGNGQGNGLGRGRGMGMAGNNADCANCGH